MNEMLLNEENQRLKYQNAKLLKINRALMQRVEEGGNQSAPYAAFEHSVHLAKQVREKTQALNETLSQLERRNRQLKTFQQRFTDAIESLSEAFVLLDSDGRIIFKNSNFEAFLQTSNLPSETVLNLKRVTEKNHGNNKQLKPVYLLSDGRWFQLNERSTVEGGRVLLYTDISALKEAETVRYDQAMAQKSVQLHHLVDNLSQGVVLLSREKQIEVWNSRFVQLSQLDVAQLQTDSSLSFLQTLTELPLPAQPRLGSDSDVQTLSDGTVLEIRVHQLQDEKTIITYTDITERHRFQQSLQENERRLRLITDNVPAMIAYISADLKFEFTNQVYIDWYGRSPRGLGISALDKSLNYKQIQPFVKRALNGESVIFESKELNRAGEPNYLLKSYVPNRDSSGAVLGFFVLIRNITERRINALALQKAHDQLEIRVVERTAQLQSLNQKLLDEVEERRRVQTDLLAASKEAEQANFSKTKFLAAVSHDLLQPLNAAQLFTSSIIESSRDDNLTPLINSVSSSLNDLENLICTLVDISKLDAGVVRADKCTFKLSDLLDNLAKEYQQQSGLYDVQLRYVSCGSLVYSDSFLLARILRNFLSNAFRYTDKGKVLLGCRRVGDQISIEVWDNGAGIEQDQRSEIFKAFKRLKSSRSAFTNGLGLGLAIVDKISKVLEHPVKVSSTFGKGSLFAVTVPLADKTYLPEVAAPQNLLLTNTELAGKTVWLVDNDFNICLAMKQLLETWGCSIISAASLADLQKRIDIGNDHADILIVDYHLDDGTNGLEVAEQINQLRSAPLPVLMITANYNKSLQKEIKEHGLLLLHKPVKAIKLKTTMLYLLNKK
ncbi:MAG: PAS domain S-box-containing protein [Psychromonas sp.]|jgi:PAS domain S-box-containing protein|uniref:hybrid sensor histidine kinase/response regulator n=1 Tax=Psychromonas sp. TaxID=1884585 RepID=UPI0039E3A6AD